MVHALTLRPILKGLATRLLVAVVAVAPSAYAAKAPNAPPVISGVPGTAVTLGMSYSFQPTASDPEGKAVTFKIRNRPRWGVFDNGTGRLTGMPFKAGTTGGILIGASDGNRTAWLPAFQVTTTATGANRTPRITGTPGTSVAAGVSYSFRPLATDADRDVLKFSISGKPGWANFTPNTGALYGTPTASDAGTYGGIVITVSDGKAQAALASFTLTVTAPVNRAPTISGVPGTAVTGGSPYAFQPSASDADGDMLTFSISGKPTWASFSPSTGYLTGTPTKAHAGIYANVRLAVSDGKASSALPAFSITVAGEATAPTNSAPVIGGNPPTTVKAYSIYEFRPTASDADGDTVSFSVANKPAWAAFHPATGRLSGSPAVADVGIHANVQITATDGKASSTLPAFSITVTEGSKEPGFDKNADFQARVAYSKAWYVNNFGDYATLEDALKDNESSTGGDMSMEGRRDLNTDPAFALSGDKSLKLTITPTGKGAGKFRVFFHKHAPPSPQKDGDSVREFYLQYAIYWTREAMTWTHRDAQKGEAFKTLLLEGYSGGQVQPGMSRRTGLISTQVNGANGCGRDVKTPKLGTLSFQQSALNDPAVVITPESKFEDYISKYGMTTSVRDDGKWGYVTAQTDWSHKGRWETGGDWTKNLIDHPDRGHPYGGWGWPELKKPADHMSWMVDGWTVVEVYVRQDSTPIGYNAEGKPLYNPSQFRIWAAPYGAEPRLIIDSENSGCDLKYNESYYQWFELLLYDTNLVEGGGFGAKVDARTFQPTPTQFEILYETEADGRSDRNFQFTAISNPSDKTEGKDHEFMGNRIGWNTGPHAGQHMAIVDSHYMGLVQDGVDSNGVPVMKHKTRLTVEPMAVLPVGGVGGATGFDTVGDYLQVQTWVEAGYRPPLDIYYDELLMSYGPIPFPGHLDKPLPQPAP